MFPAQSNRHSTLSNSSVSRHLVSECVQLNSRNIITILKYTLNLMISTTRSFLSNWCIWNGFRVNYLNWPVGTLCFDAVNSIACKWTLSSSSSISLLCSKRIPLRSVITLSIIFSVFECQFSKRLLHQLFSYIFYLSSV